MITEKKKHFNSKHLSDEEMAELLRKRAEELGHTPLAKSLNGTPGMPGLTAYTMRFGSWGNALKAAGLKGRRTSPKNLSSEEMISMLKQKIDQIGYVPTKDALAKDFELPNPDTYTRRFGSWNEALRLAGFEVTISDEELISMLRDRILELGYVPTMQAAAEDYKLPSVTTYQRHFNSWNNAIKLAGFKPNKAGRKTKKGA